MINVDINKSEQKIDLKVSLNFNEQDLLHLNLLNKQEEMVGNGKLINQNHHIEQETEQNTKLSSNKTMAQSKQKIMNKKGETMTSSLQNQQRPFLNIILKKSRFLNEIYKHFCNMTYANTGKKSFEEMGKNIASMSLNRFMLFSKEFSIDRIIRYDIKYHSQKQLAQSYLKVKTQTLDAKNEQKKLPTSPKPVMLQIPVKNINNTEKTLTKLYRKNSLKYDQMTYQEFVQMLTQIFQIFQRNVQNLYIGEKFSNRLEIEDKYLSDVLIISDGIKFEKKISNLKIEFKGAISYHQESVHKSCSFLNKKLVIHGGRSSDEMKNELQVYQASKIDKKENWIEKQPQPMGVYSKSRVFYRPNPSKIYETNDVIRLARKQAGRTQTQNLFNYSLIMSQKRQPKNVRQQGLSFSKIFQDKTNKFSQKLQLLKQKLSNKDKDLKLKLNTNKEDMKDMNGEDEILQRYFQNEKKVYGDESIMASLQR